MSVNEFVAWFQHHGGVLDTSVMGIADFPGSGRGGIALQDIPVCLFQIRSRPINFSFSLRKTAQFSRFLVH